MSNATVWMRQALNKERVGSPRFNARKGREQGRDITKRKFEMEYIRRGGVKTCTRLGVSVGTARYLCIERA